MVCKYCGCENLDGSTNCVYCGEPLPEQNSSVGNIMSAFAGVSVEDTETEAGEKHAGITVISAVGRLRRTDVSVRDGGNAADEAALRQEAETLMDGKEAEQLELNWQAAAETIGQDAAEAVAEEADAAQEAAEALREAAEEGALEEAAAVMSVSDQAEEIVKRAVAKIMENDGPKEAAPAEEKAPEEAEAPAEEPEEPEAEEAPKPYKVPQPEASPLDFHLEEVPDAEKEAEPGSAHNFVLAAAEAVAPSAAYKSGREEPSVPADGEPEADGSAEDAPQPEGEREKEPIDFIPIIPLTGTSQIMKESKEEEERAKEEEAQEAARTAAAEKRSRAAKRRRNSWIWILFLLLLLAGAAYLFWIRPMQRYNTAKELMEQGNYREALSLFEQSGDYKDAKKLADECLARLIGTDPTANPTEPDVTQPDTSVPQTQPVPDESTSAAETQPPVTEPVETTPEETTPEETTPEETTPEETTPAVPADVKVGDIIRYGRYEQDNVSSNGKEEIEWIVLAVEEDRICLISRYILDTARYLNPSRWATYSSSAIRIWLFSDFYNAAFSAEEKKNVLVYDIDPGVNPKYPGISQGAVVDDEVGLLSVQQVEKYFPAPADKQCTATAYAVKRGVYVAANGFSPWWTCTMGQNNESACLVRSDGAINYNGRELTVPTFGARPVIWLSKEAVAD